MFYYFNTNPEIIKNDTLKKGDDSLKTVTDRFLEYVKHHTTSDESVKTCPSTKQQSLFASFLAEECKQIGLDNITVDDNGYVYAFLPSNTDKDVQNIGFIAHMDTSPDASGEHVSPQITRNYDGKDIVLRSVSISPEEFPDLAKYKGETIITSDGITLLGADDKAGIAEILTAMEYLIQHPEIEHGKVSICFTPDEEIGRGADLFNIATFGADFAYTVDGGAVGELEYENFNAARANITVQGKSVHPGQAKNTMINAGLIAAEIISAFPTDETPSTTEGYDGFFHLCYCNSNIGSANLAYLIRDFDKQSFENRKAFIENLIAEKNKKYHNRIYLTIYDEYQNMINQIQDKPHIIELAKSSMVECGITPIIQPIRGGTDGARLSFKGLPCPNLFTGGHNFHGPYEYIPVSSMEKAVKLIVTICKNVVNLKI